MTITRLALRGLKYHARTYAAVAFGVATSVAVMAGALLVGTSVRASLASLAAARLGRADVVVAGEQPFSETLAQRLSTSGLAAGSNATPILTLLGTARHEGSGRRAGHVQVYGVDERFFTFHGVAVDAPTGATMMLSPDLAEELGAVTGDVVVVRVARLSDIPADSLLGKKEDIGRSLRLRVLATLARDSIGEFSLTPTQGPIRAVFVPLARLQRDLDLPGRANAVLLSNPKLTVPMVQATLAATVDAHDLDLDVAVMPVEAPVARGGPTAPLPPTIAVTASSGLIPDASVTAIADIAGRESLAVTPVLTWLANRMTIGERVIPYSLVTAIGADAAGDTQLASLLQSGAAEKTPPIVLNDWAAKDAHAVVGDSLDLEYYRWADEGVLRTEHATFRVAGVIPMRGLTLDRHLAPSYPGITDAVNVSDWSPPFPIDLRLVRPQDNDYWKQFRTTPKAFIALEAGQRLWRTKYGQVTSMRLSATTAAVDIEAIAARVRTAAARAIDPLHAGFSVIDVAHQSAVAAQGATDFGEYLSYFSFFLVISALLLTSLLFRLGIEQRLGEIGVLRASGFSLAAVRKIWMIEGSIVAMAGGMAGVGLAIGWASLMMRGLRTWWVDAVGTTRLSLHIDVLPLLAGAAGAALAAAIAIVLTIRGLSRYTPRALLTGSNEPRSTRRSHGRRPWMALVILFAAVALSALSAVGVIPPAGGFFGAGGLVLTAGLAAFGWWLRRRPASSGDAADAGGATEIANNRSAPLARLGLRNAAWRPGRSLTSAGLVASAVFLLVAVDAFRKGGERTEGPASGTGGFALIAESALPIVNDPGTEEGRLALGLQTAANDPEFAGVTILAARLRPGDDASCLNLYVPARPRIVGVPDRLIETGPFRFAKSQASASADAAVRANPWKLLGDADAEGIVPAIADATSLEFVLHAAVGDVITIDRDTARPVRLRIVGALDDSMLQGELLIASRAFTTLFPDAPGYRVFLVSIAAASAERVDRLSRILEERLDGFGLDVEESARRLAAYHRVENTYLSTFQALGALGLVLGCFGLGAITARNVLERRRELALLGAAGYSARDLRAVVISEQLALVAVGLLVGVAAAAVAVAPVILSRGGHSSVFALLWLGIVSAAGVISALAATRHMRRLPLVASLRSG